MSDMSKDKATLIYSLKKNILYYKSDLIEMLCYEITY